MNDKIYDFTKRFIDITGSVVGIVIFGIPMVLIALLIKTNSRGPAIFAQVRVGKGGGLFKMYKFRSMVDRAEEVLKKWEKENPKLLAEYKANSFKLADDPRLTGIGKFLRKTSLDELPQLFNVLKSEMSLVGPRGYKPDELEHQAKVHPESKNDIDDLLAVKPGITGLWQVSGRSEVDFGERVKLDAQYARRKSIFEDFKIICRTPSAVLKGKGAY